MEFLTLIMNHWEWIIMAMGGLPLILKSVRQFAWAKLKHVKRIWQTPGRIDEAEGAVRKCIEDLREENTQQHEEAKEIRERNKNEVNERIDKLEKVVKDNHKELVNHIINLAKDKGDK